MAPMVRPETAIAANSKATSAQPWGCCSPRTSTLIAVPSCAPAIVRVSVDGHRVHPREGALNQAVAEEEIAIGSEAAVAITGHAGRRARVRASIHWQPPTMAPIAMPQPTGPIAPATSAVR